MPAVQRRGGSPFVGRRTELAAVVSVLAQLGDGRGGIALVTGGAGIGKSSLVATALDEATTGEPDGGRIPEPWATGFGECLPDLLMPPLWPVHRAVASAARGVHDGEGWTKVLDLLRPTRDSAETGSVGPGWDRLAVLGDIVDRLVRLVRSTPVALVLEDLQWADAESLALLRLLAPELGRTPLVVLATARPATDDQHGTALAALTGSPSTSVIALGPLSVADVEEYLVAGTFAGDPTDVRALSGGVPLLLPAAVGVVERVGDATTSSRVDVPTLVRRLTVSLTDEHVAILESASVVTTALDAELAAAAGGSALAVAADATAAAVRAGLLTVSLDGSGLTFVHDLVRESLRGRLSPERARAASRRLALILAQRPGTPAVRVAGYWDAAGPDAEASAQAARWWQRAADESARVRAYEDAATQQARAASAAEVAGLPDLEQAEVLLAGARAWYRAGRYNEAVATARRAAAVADQADRPDLMAEAALAVTWVVYPEAQAVLGALSRTALDRGGARLDPGLRARLLAHQVAMLGNDAPITGAGTAIEALRIGRRSGQPRALFDAIGARMATLPETGSAVDQLDLADEAIDISSRFGPPIGEVIARTWRLKALIELARMDLASTELGRLEAVADATRLPLAAWHALRAKAATAILRGDFAVVPELHDQATSIAVASGDIVATNIGIAAVFEMAVRRGVPLPTELLTAAEVSPPSPLIEAPLALLLLDIGRTDEARIIYDRLVPLLGVQTTVRPWGPVLYPLLNLAEKFGDTATASLLVDELAPRVEGVPGGVGTSTVWFVGNPRLPLGRALALAGRDEEALPVLEEALRLNQRIGARPDVALTRIELAHVGSRLGDDRELRRTHSIAALAHARLAVDECRGLDMPGHADRAEALVRELERTVSSSDPLSPREREVVDLVLAGLTNHDIAQRLFVSERTVESHVRNILMKLGCRNRTELIRLWS